MKSLTVIIWVIILVLFSGYINSIINPALVNNVKNMDTVEYKQAVFAWGCFWCMEGIFESQPWVIEAISGYAWGEEVNADYKSVSSGTTGHRESVQVIYNPTMITYEKLIELYWTQIDPTDDGGQFADRWFHYTTAIYYQNIQERDVALHSRDELSEWAKFDKPIVTNIEKFTTFFPAEEAHQDYYKKSSLRYNIYKKASGRSDFIENNWKTKIMELQNDEESLKNRLTPLQYYVTQEEWTEKAFTNEYWDNKEKGIYVDIVDGTPLFSSLDKFDSGTGWPSFSKPINIDFVVEEDDTRFLMKRTEVKSKNADSHLGHIFLDGPKELWWKRYCINSASLKFISDEDLKEKGYSEYIEMFK